MRIAIQLIVIVIFVFGGAQIMKMLIESKKVAETAPREIPVPLVHTIESALAPVQLEVSGHGEVREQESAMLTAEVGGRVLTVSPSLVMGGAFAEGDTLLELDPVDLTAAQAAAAATVASAERALAQIEADAAQAVRELAELGEQDPSPLARREPQIAEAQAALEAAKANLARADRDLERVKVTAPFAGRVVTESVSPGALVGPGQALATLMATSSVEVHLGVPEQDLASLQLDAAWIEGGVLESGPSATVVQTFAGQEHEWAGRVARIAPRLDPRSRRVTLVIQVDDPFGAAARERGAPLLPGSFVSVTLTGRELAGAVRLPREALRTGSRVFLVEDGKLIYRDVTVIWRDEASVVIGSGLTGGERICISPIAAPVDQMAVRDASDVEEAGE